MIVTVTLTPALDKTVILPGFRVNEVNRIQSIRLDPGGKGINVSKGLRALGVDSLATGILGGDTGRYIERSLHEIGIACDFVWTDRETRTNLKVIDPVLHTNTDINEPGAPVSADVLETVYRKAEAAVQPGDIVVFAGKAPPEAPDTVFADWTVRLRERGVRVYLDADGELLIQGAKACPTFIKPNDAELSRLVGRSFSDVKEMAAAARMLTETGIETVVVSLGGDGALLVTRNIILRGYGLKVEVQSTVGAGDSMLAAFACAETRHMRFRDGCALAMAFSAAAVTTPGTQPAEPEVVEALLKQVVIEDMSI